MPTIEVVKAFTLQMDPPQIGEQPDPKDPTGEKKVPVYGQSEKLRFVPGLYDVSDEVADHWYTKAHLRDYVPPPPAPGTHQFAQEALLAAQGVRMMQPVHQQGQAPAPLGDDVRVMQRSGTVPEGAHYFAGQPQEDKPLPPNEVRPPGEARTETTENRDTSYLSSRPPAAPAEPPPGGHRRRGH